MYRVSEPPASMKWGRYRPRAGSRIRAVARGDVQADRNAEGGVDPRAQPRSASMSARRPSTAAAGVSNEHMSRLTAPIGEAKG